MLSVRILCAVLFLCACGENMVGAVIDVKDPKTTNVHRCHFITACKLVKTMTAGAEHYCAYSTNENIQCPATETGTDACKSMAESRTGVTALDEFMYLTGAKVDSKVVYTDFAASTLSRDSMLTTMIVGCAISFLMF